MMNRRCPTPSQTTCAQAALLVGSVIGLVGACSENARYRTLSFFLDGVPAPGTLSTPGPAPTDRKPVAADPAAASRPRPSVFAHPPYRDNSCARCHNIEAGQLFREVKDGLCLTCHPALTEGKEFVHGPVAVNDCLFCHHHHVAPYPKLLLDQPPGLCLQCHDRADLGPGEHHAKLNEISCTSCHDPHGGSDRFFLKRSDR